MEDIKWTAVEEMKNKENEINKLREDIKIASATRADALQHQRNDLIETYEGLMKQREVAALTKEREIEQIINHLENKFETIQTESLQLKNELRDTSIKYEQTYNDLKVQQDQNRILSYKIEDLQKSQLILQDTYQRKSMELNNMVDTCRIEHTQELNTANQEIMKVSSIECVYIF